MDANLTTAIVSASSAVIVSVTALWFNANQIGNRIASLETALNKRIDDLKDSLNLLDKHLSQRIDALTERVTKLDERVAELEKGTRLVH